MEWAGEKGLRAFDWKALKSYHDSWNEPTRIHASCEDYRAGATVDVEADDADLSAGRHIECETLLLRPQKDGDSLRARIGVSLDHEASWVAADGRRSRSHVYGGINLYNEFLDGSKVEVSGVGFSTRDERLWVGLCLGGTYVGQWLLCAVRPCQPGEQHRKLRRQLCHQWLARLSGKLVGTRRSGRGRSFRLPPWRNAFTQLLFIGMRRDTSDLSQIKGVVSSRVLF